MEWQNALIEDLRILQAIFRHADAAILVIDKSSHIVLANKELERITGLSSAELESMVNWIEIVHPEDRTIVENYLLLLQANPDEVKYEFRIMHKDGIIRTGFLTGTLIENSPYKVLSIIDITERKDYEKALQEAKEKAEASDRLKTAFLGNMSHEIRTPMNAIIGFASLMKTELSDEKRDLYLDNIINGSNDLLKLIEKIITISRLDSGQLKLNRREFNLNQRLHEIECRFREEMDNNGKPDIRLTLTEGKKDTDFTIYSDPLKLTEILNNLLENALKFTQTGEISFGYYFLEEGDKEGKTLLFFVKDTGKGIEKEKTKVIFDRFVKIVEKNETIFRGSGLGLSIAKGLSDLFGGTIWVESTPGAGSKFYFSLPLSNIKTSRKAGSLQTKKISDDWSKYELLLAEDVESNYLYIKELLAPTKIKILRARDGVEAVELFESTPEINIILMDILMPGMDGYEATTEIRKIRPAVPVIAQSAFTFEGDMQDGLYAGCFNDYIMKPFTREILVGVMKKYLFQD